jgi:hypothetical protein
VSGVHVTIDQSDTGWRVEASGADDVVIETDATGVTVGVHPDDDDTGKKPLDVSLGNQ